MIGEVMGSDGEIWYRVGPNDLVHGSLVRMPSKLPPHPGKLIVAELTDPCIVTAYEDGKAVYNPDRAMAMQKSFLLDESLVDFAVALRSMRGLALDWGRFDTTQAHVVSNRAFSRKLEDLGVGHGAEEYRGDPSNRTWTEDGRFAKRVLPFLRKHLASPD